MPQERQVFVILIEPNKEPVNIYLTKKELTLEKYQEWVGGKIETIPALPNKRIPRLCVVNEEGFLKEMPRNSRAEDYVDERFKGFGLYGTVVIVNRKLFD